MITGPVALDAPVGADVVRVETTTEMERAVREALPAADVLIMAAAPADYQPASAAPSKHPRAAGPTAIQLVPTSDILSSTSDARKPGSVMVGFALETGDAVARGQAKLERKKLDLIVVNDALEPGAGFEVETNRVTLIARGEEPRALPLRSKLEVAESILDAVESRLV